MPGALIPRLPRAAAAAGIALAAAALPGCGGGNPLGNPPDVVNGPGVASGKLSFVYYQRCIETIVQAELDVDIGGVVSKNSCAGSGCHDNVNGTGGAFRVVRDAAPVDLADPSNTPDLIRASDLYKNFYSAQGEVLVGNPGGSRLLNKPLVRGVLHGGGLIFGSADDANAKRIAFWIDSPVGQAQDEFSLTAAERMFDNGDPFNGACRSE